MKIKLDQGLNDSDAKIKTIFWVAIVASLVLGPFSIYNFINQVYPIAIGSGMVVIILMINGWLSYQGRYYPLLPLLGLGPAIISALFFAFKTAGMVGALWCYPSIISFYFLLSERYAWLTNALLLLMAIPCAFIYLDQQLAYRVVATLVCVSAFSVIFLRIISIQQKQLKEMVITDPLTGLSNRVQLDSVLQHASETFKRNQSPMCLLSLDLDYFKNINDELGHAKGDHVLAAFGKLLLNRIRRSDRVFRVGGEEFLMVLYNTDLDQANSLAENIRREIEGYEFLPDRQVTVSGGVAECRQDESIFEWLKRCDDKLYQAKQQGRNQIVS